MKSEGVMVRMVSKQAIQWVGYGVVAVLALLACAVQIPEGEAAEPAAHGMRPRHHTDQGFRNNDIGQIDKSLWTVVQWQLKRWRDRAEQAPFTPTPQVAPDLNYLHANARQGTAMLPTLTWIGHATALVQASGLNVLTDPVFSERASPLSFLGPQRLQAPGLALSALPHIDVVLISHNHYDHLDRDSVHRLQAQPGGAPLFLVPLGLKAWFESEGIDNVVELDWWQEHVLVPGVSFVLTPVQHWSARGLSDRHRTLWGGWVGLGPTFCWYFSGDTGYSSDFRATQAWLAARPGQPRLDLALLPIGAYEPRWFLQEQHVNPDEAVQIHLDLQARRSVGIHWGTFRLSDEAPDQPPQDLALARRARQIADDAFVTLALGETLRWPRR